MSGTLTNGLECAVSSLCDVPIIIDKPPNFHYLTSNHLTSNCRQIFEFHEMKSLVRHSLKCKHYIPGPNSENEVTLNYMVMIYISICIFYRKSRKRLLLVSFSSPNACFLEMFFFHVNTMFYIN